MQRHTCGKQSFELDVLERQVEPHVFALTAPPDALVRRVGRHAVHPLARMAAQLRQGGGASMEQHAMLKRSTSAQRLCERCQP